MSRRFYFIVRVEVKKCDRANALASSEMLETVIRSRQIIYESREMIVLLDKLLAMA